MATKRGQPLHPPGAGGARELGQVVEALKTSLGSALPDDVESPLRKALAGVHGGAETLRRLSRPFLAWTGKAERLSFDVPTLPLFVHERLSHQG